MKTVAVIAEYNPFHYGHKYQLEKAKALTGAEYAVVLMSGNYVQRGEPAIFDKMIRTKCALKNGADLVLELPLFAASASAELFAEGAITLLEMSGIADYVCFGSEAGTLELLRQAAVFLNKSPDFKAVLKNHLHTGSSWPLARSQALKALGRPDLADLLAHPNNILATAYLQTLDRLSSNILPVTLPRKNSDYHDPALHHYASATAVRKAIMEGRNYRHTMPESCFLLLEEAKAKGILPHKLDYFSPIFHYLMKTKDLQQIKEIWDVTEGIENRITASIAHHYSLDNIIADIKTKRYTFTKIQRTLLHILLDIRKKDIALWRAQGFGYIRVLGFLKKSVPLLSALHLRSALPVVTNLKHAPRLLQEIPFAFLAKEIMATDLYYLAAGRALPKNYEYTQPLMIL